MRHRRTRLFLFRENAQPSSVPISVMGLPSHAIRDGLGDFAMLGLVSCPVHTRYLRVPGCR